MLASHLQVPHYRLVWRFGDIAYCLEKLVQCLVNWQKVAKKCNATFSMWLVDIIKVLIKHTSST